MTEKAKETRISFSRGTVIVRLEAPEHKGYYTRYPYSVEVEGVGRTAKTGAVYCGYKHRFQITRYAHQEGLGAFPDAEVALEVERALARLVDEYRADHEEAQRKRERADLLNARLRAARGRLTDLQAEIAKDEAELADLIRSTDTMIREMLLNGSIVRAR